MTMRTTEKTITFDRPFCLKGVDSVLPPADYRVVTDREMIEGLSFVALTSSGRDQHLHTGVRKRWCLSIPWISKRRRAGGDEQC